MSSDLRPFPALAAMLLAALALAGAGPAAAGPCATDADCKGRRVCKQGACVAPVACGSDRDCPGEDVCKGSVCVAPTAEDLGEAPPAPVSRPPPARPAGVVTPPAAAPAARHAPAGPAPAAPTPRAAPAEPTCAIDKDCPGELVCNDGRCQPPLRAAAPAAVPAPRAVAPPPAAPPPLAAPPAPPAAAAPLACRRDKDCPGELVCEGGTCNPPASAGASRPAAAAPAAPSASKGARFVAQGLTVRDTRTNLTWQRGVALRSNLEQVFAQRTCADLDLGGMGWRLPTVEELLTLTGRGTQEAAAGVFEDWNTWLWSSTEEGRLTFWAVNPRLGTKVTRQGSEGNTTTVRCVR